MPTNILFPVAVVAAFLVLLKIVLATKKRSTTSLRYKRIDLFNSTEHAFLIALRQTAPSHIAVLAKVRVADIVSPQGNDVAAFNRIARKHVDFVLYNLQNRSVLRAIELDGPTHASKRATKSDNVKNSCFASARIPLARVPSPNGTKPKPCAHCLRLRRRTSWEPALLLLATLRLQFLPQRQDRRTFPSEWLHDCRHHRCLLVRFSSGQP